MKRASAKKRAAVVEAYRAGEAPASISKQHKVSTASVYRWAKAKPNGAAPPKNGRRKPTAASVKRAERRSRKVDTIEAFVEALFDSLRAPLVASIRELVSRGVREELDALVKALNKRTVTAIT